jgi:hypothetical protein
MFRRWLMEKSFWANIKSLLDIYLIKPERKKKPELKKIIPVTIQKLGLINRFS